MQSRCIEGKGTTPEFAVVDGHGRVFFNIEDKSELAVLDPQTLKIQSHYSLAPCEESSGLAIDPRGRLYSVCRNGVMVVSDPNQGRVIGQTPIGHGPTTLRGSTATPTAPMGGTGR